AAFDGEKMIGSTRINSENVFENELPVFSTLINGQGYEKGNPIILKVWSENNIFSLVFTMEAIYDSYISDVYPEGDGKYSIVNITKGSSPENNTLIVFPNPATDNISIISQIEIIKVSIFNCLGQSVYQSNINNTNIQINTSNFDSGIYIIKIETTNGLETHKIKIN
ncbi:MAG: T9SS type A sorting domain-containing protein, partial [Bacteroidales bacterium]|nr:T9SS type A sorting domain-containing protein [Bacteroidales bacterium]